MAVCKYHPLYIYILLQAFKHAVVHLEEREGPLGGHRMPWWNAVLGKGARKHRGHGHGHIKHHDIHEDEVRTSHEPSAILRPAIGRSSRHRSKLASARHVLLYGECGYVPRGRRFGTGMALTCVIGCTVLAMRGSAESCSMSAFCVRMPLPSVPSSVWEAIMADHMDVHTLTGRAGIAQEPEAAVHKFRNLLEDADDDDEDDDDHDNEDDHEDDHEGDHDDDDKVRSHNTDMMLSTPAVQTRSAAASWSAVLQLIVLKSCSERDPDIGPNGFAQATSAMDAPLDIAKLMHDHHDDMHRMFAAHMTPGEPPCC